jgi:hypothetical protein
MKKCLEKTSVLVGCFGPVDVSTNKELIDRASIQVNFESLQGKSGKYNYILFIKI